MNSSLTIASSKIAPAQSADGQWSDAELTAEIERVRTNLQTWMERNDLWSDCGFKSFLEHVDGEPSDPPVVSIFWFEGGMHSVLSGEDYDGLEPAFNDLLSAMGYHYENLNGTTIAIYPEDEQLAHAFQAYFHWQWVCSLLNEDTADVYHELYDQFAKRPEDLQRLKPRDFEILLFRLFQHQGFETVLGPGRGDEGVDIRFVQKAPLGDVLTLVQAKRYAPHRQIDQTEVSALYGSVALENADRGLFVTTSKYAPVSRRWAARTGGKLELAAGEHVVEWCTRASAGIIADKASLVSVQHVMRVISEVAGKVDPRIVHASGGWNITDNWFALVLKETKHAALLMGIPSAVLSDDGYGQRGTHIPKLDEETISLFDRGNVWRAKRSSVDDRLYYWDGTRLYAPWNGSPCHFDYCD